MPIPRPVPLLLALALAPLLRAADEPQAFPKMAIDVGQLIETNYYDATRIKPRLMVERALRAVENAEITADGEWTGETLVFKLQDRLATIRAPEPKDLNAAMVLVERLRDEIESDRTTLANDRKRALTYAMLNGALSTLDPHTYIEPPEPSKQNTFEDITGTFFGIGAFLTSEDGQVAIERVMPGLPAERSGVQDGDRILAIDGERTAGLSLDQAVKRIKGPKGTPVKLTLERPASNQTLDLTVIRDKVEVVVWRTWSEGQIGYFRLDQFNQNAARELAQSWLRLAQQVPPVKGLVLDLRFNGGGLLDQAQLISDFFLARNQEIVRTVSTEGDGTTMRTSGRPRMIDVPVLVLTSGVSASASEIVSGALQRNDRAAIIGATTYGKGSVQVMRPLRDGSRLRITTQEYQLPGGVSIQDVGVTPDVHLVRRSVRNQDGSAVDLLPYSPPREQDDEFALANTKTYRHRTSYELPWLAPFATSDELKKSSISARDFTPDDEARLVIGLLAQALAEPGFADGWPAALKGNNGRQYLLEHLRQPVATQAETQAKALGEALAHLPQPITWGGSAVPAAGSLSLAFTGPATVEAGGSVSLGFTITNPGAAEAGRLYGLVQADKGSPLWEGEVLFGAAPAGATIQGILPWQIPLRLVSGEERFTLQVRGANEQVVASLPVQLQVQGRPRPHLGFEWRLKGETRLGTGKQTTIQLRLRNTGDAPTGPLALRVFKDDNPFVQLSAPSLRTVGPLAPGAKDDSPWIDVPVTIQSELQKGDSFTAEDITLLLRAEEQFEDRPSADAGRNRVSLFASFKIKVGVDLPATERTYHPPRLILGNIAHPGGDRAEVTVRLEDDNATFVTAFLDEDKVFLARVGDQREFRIPVKLKPGANNLRVVAMDADDLTEGLPIRMWGDERAVAPVAPATQAVP